jgi:hypothetical protein
MIVGKGNGIRFPDPQGHHSWRALSLPILFRQLLVEAEPKIWVSSADMDHGGFLSFPDSKFINRIWVERIY